MNYKRNTVAILFFELKIWYNVCIELRSAEPRAAHGAVNHRPWGYGSTDILSVRHTRVRQTEKENTFLLQRHEFQEKNAMRKVVVY